jgi:hypothetical protein
MEPTAINEQSLEYVGKELEIFAHAREWKNYWAGVIRPYVFGDVLEVGAGIGANTSKFHNSAVRSVHSLEPDVRLAIRLRDTACTLLGGTVSVGTISTLSQQFDSIVYIDVLEHIEDDQLELEKAATLLRPHGNLIVLGPAHQGLFSPFDAAIGHYRRYDRRSLSACSPSTCRLVRILYLDSVGLLFSWMNRYILKQRQPTIRQILFWDRYVIATSRLVDHMFGHRLGKSILGVWERT